jgi:hypothetical protein
VLSPGDPGRVFAAIRISDTLSFSFPEEARPIFADVAQDSLESAPGADKATVPDVGVLAGTKSVVAP